MNEFGIDWDWRRDFNFNWVGWIFIILIIFGLKSGMVWNSWVCHHCLIVFPINKVLSPSLPLFFTSDIGNIRIKLDSRLVWDSWVGHVSLVVFPIIEILCPRLPLLFTSNNSFKVWVKLCKNFIFKLKCRVVWNSWVSHHCLVVFPINKVLGPSLPLFFSSNWCSWRTTWTTWHTFHFSIKLKSGMVWNSWIGHHGLIIFPINEVLCPSLPLFFASYISNLSIKLESRLVWNSWVGH